MKDLINAEGRDAGMHGFPRRAGGVYTARAGGVYTAGIDSFTDKFLA